MPQLFLASRHVRRPETAVLASAACARLAVYEPMGSQQHSVPLAASWTSPEFPLLPGSFLRRVRTMRPWPSLRKKSKLQKARIRGRKAQQWSQNRSAAGGITAQSQSRTGSSFSPSLAALAHTAHFVCGTCSGPWHTAHGFLWRPLTVRKTTRSLSAAVD